MPRVQHGEFRAVQHNLVAWTASASATADNAFHLQPSLIENGWKRHVTMQQCGNLACSHCFATVVMWTIEENIDRHLPSFHNTYCFIPHHHISKYHKKATYEQALLQRCISLHVWSCTWFPMLVTYLHMKYERITICRDYDSYVSCYWVIRRLRWLKMVIPTVKTLFFFSSFLSHKQTSTTLAVL